MNRLLLSFAAAGLVVAAPATAAVVTPVGVTATSTFNNGFYTPQNLINGSGLSGGLHSNFFGDMWMTDLGASKASLTFDLGGVFNLSGASLWQFNFGTNTPVISTLDRGVKEFRLLTSLDGVTYAEAFSGTLARSLDGSPVAAQDFAFSGAASFVRLDILNNYTQGTIYERDEASGLSEVRFSGAAVPEPATWAMMIGGFAMVGAAMRRRKISVRFA